MVSLVVCGIVTAAMCGVTGGVWYGDCVVSLVVCGIVTVAMCGVTGGVWNGDCGNVQCHWWCVAMCEVSLVMCGMVTVAI